MAGAKQRERERDRRPLTVRDVESLRVGEKAYGSLAPLPGSLMVRARRSGKSFFFRYRNKVDGERCIHIGAYDPRGAPHGLLLKQATTKACELAKQLQQTPDLGTHRSLQRMRDQEAREAELRARRDAADHTLGRLCDVYVAHLERQGKAAHRDARCVFKLHLTPELRAKPAAAVTAADITVAVRQLLQPDSPGVPKPRTAGKLRSYLSAAFALVLRAESDPTAPTTALGFNLTANPAAAVRAHSGIRARDRVLTEDELRYFMQSAAKAPEPVADALALLLLLGGQRPAQLLRATIEDVRGAVLSLRDSKGRRQSPRVHTLPVSEAARAILSRRIEVARQLGCQYLFSTNGKAPVRLETLSAFAKRISDAFRAQAKGVAGAGFQLRDVRRTCETQLASLGVSRDVRAQLLSHGLGGIQQQHYDRHDYMEDKRRALAAWERRLREVVDGIPRATNVVAFKGAA